MNLYAVLVLMVVAGCFGYIAGHENGWRSGRLHGRAEVFREQSRR